MLSPTREIRADGRLRLPPGQHLTAGWPVLHYGSIPRVDLEKWRFHIWVLIKPWLRNRSKHIRLFALWTIVKGVVRSQGEAEDGHGAEGQLSHDQLLTDPEQAADFVKQTGVDALAIAIGTSHGAYKFTRKPTGDILAIQRVKEIHERIPNTHLVMHGSSSVPQEWLEIIREYGGDMKETYGVPVEEIQQGIKYGVRKVNIDTDIRLAMTGAIRRHLAKNKSEFDPRKFLKDATAAAKDICKARFEAFGSAGQAGKIKPISLETMANRYLRGELKAIIK